MITMLFYFSVPPGEPIISDERGAQIKSLIGPYNEGEPLLLICEAIGGEFLYFECKLFYNVHFIYLFYLLLSNVLLKCNNFNCTFVN